MNIANIIEVGRYGGPQNRIVSIANSLKPLGIDTYVIYPQDESAVFKKHLEKNNIKNICLPLHRLTKDKKHLLKYIFFFIYELVILTRYLKKHEFDLIHVSGGAWQFKGAIAGKLAGIKVLWHLNDTQMPFILRFVFRIIATFCADSFIVAGERVKDYYLKSFNFDKKKVFDVQAPVDTKKFNPVKITNNAFIPSTKRLSILTVSHITPIKGLEYFVNMAAQLNTKYTNLEFYIIGEQYNNHKKYAEKLFNICKDKQVNNIQFCGAKDNIPEVLKDADIYVCSSIAEASPISVWEAMSMEKPIVSTDVGDVSRFIKNGYNGYITPACDSNELTNMVSKFIENENLRDELGINARKTALKYLDTSIILKSYYKIYSNFKNSNLCKN